MALPRTEAAHDAAEGLDLRADGEILSVLLEAQRQALEGLADAHAALGEGAALMADTVRAGGCLTYVAAGSSGLMALADAAELGGTFGIPAAQVRILMAGGVPTCANMPGDTEDDAQDAARTVESLGADDTVIAVTASGTTPYPNEIARLAHSKSARVICIANNPEAAIFDHADVAICLPTPPEVISGSTRMGAATAQKVALNAMSTLMGIRLGHVHDGMMVNLVADNAKLRARAAGMVARIAGVDAATAQNCLGQAQGAVKPAVLCAAGVSAERAAQILTETKGHLRAALARV
ncbi:N-acetylmuramic acid 6-phosphate etherase [Aliiroseovarius subalbicans]|uniref:N-acetylmuramic acid 6-phosphate etherase n=1 Tax=Aliiroseovarius subalbicans TaxID=2925840 RepID=UPI001F57250A|nr:N-acetylmuramic acid 6-phosphate etherase [Aliiroseovarius subalbicans]MCI2397777.1 N-acetylmuramic acid 6-phosphate etherase [Aliiroseovarius subalbicans]